MFATNMLQAGGSRTKPLWEILTDASLDTNANMVLDAGDSASYGGTGQTWTDRSGTTNWYRGSSTGSDAADPTFNGVAGRLSQDEYFSFDGGDYMLPSGGNPSWIQQGHKNNATITVCAAVFIPAANVTGMYLLGSPWTGTDVGFDFAISNTNALTWLVTDGNGADGNEIAVAGPALSTGAWHFVAASIDEAGGSGGSFLYADGAYAQVSGSDTFDGAYLTPTSGSASYTYAIGALRAGAQSNMPSGSRIGAMAQFGSVLSKSEVDTIYRGLRTRWNFG